MLPTKGLSRSFTKKARLDDFVDSQEHLVKFAKDSGRLELSRTSPGFRLSPGVRIRRRHFALKGQRYRSGEGGGEKPSSRLVRTTSTHRARCGESSHRCRGHTNTLARAHTHTHVPHTVTFLTISSPVPRLAITEPRAFPGWAASVGRNRLKIRDCRGG